MTNNYPNYIISLSSNVEYLNLGCTGISDVMVVDGFGGRNYSKVVFSNAETLTGVSFRNCVIGELELPKVKNGFTQGYTYFSGCVLNTLKLPELNTIYYNVFQSASIKNIVFGNLSYMQYSSTFRDNHVLERVVLDQGFVPNVYSCYNLFTSTPIGDSTYLGYFGSIYVRQSMLAS